MEATDLSTADLDADLAGVDRLELAVPVGRSAGRRLWRAVWPKVAAIAAALAVWQLVAWSGWKPSYLLPGPVTTARHLWDDRSVVAAGTATTLLRAVEFYLIALAVGTAVAIVVSRSRLVRDGISPLLTGLQTMPNVAWVPFAILIFGTRGTATSAILFVTLLGTAPAIAIGAVSAFDAIPPVLLRAGQVLGARRWRAYRYVILPAALPGYVAGMKQGWAFAWRSLMAGELIVNVAGHHSLGQLLAGYQDQSQAADVMAVMVVILAVGLLVDSLVFARVEAAVLRRRGLSAAAV